MAWPTLGPQAPISGTVTTSAWEVANIKDPLDALNLRTGAGDPGGAGKSLESNGATSAAWVGGKVARAGDVMTGDLQVNRSSGPTGYLILGNNTAYYVGFDGTKHVIATTFLDVQNDTRIYRGSNTAQGFVFLGMGGQYIGFDGTNGVFSGNTLITAANIASQSVAFATNASSATNSSQLGGVAAAGYALVADKVPTGLVASVRTAAEIATGWSRETNLDGRLQVGDGTTFSQTFTQGTNYGSSWTPAAGVSSSDTIGVNNGTLAASAGTTGVVNGGGHATEQSGTGATTSNIDNHTHSGPPITLSGSVAKSGTVTLSGTSTVWIPPARAYVFCRKN